MNVGFLAVACALTAMPSQGHATDVWKASCPAQKFDKYIAAFADDVAVQRTFTKTPLKSIALVDAEPEPRAVTRWLGKSQIQFPLMPSLGEQREKQLQLWIGPPLPQLRNVELLGADTGYGVQYRFEYQSACWVLTSVTDQSL